MRFKLDENLPASLISAFEESGHEAIAATAQGLQGAADPKIAEVCRQEQRVLVTLDIGFADIRAYPPAEHSGIVVLRLRDQTIPYIRATISRVLRLLTDRPVAKTLWIVEDDKVRFRS